MTGTVTGYDLGFTSNSVDFISAVLHIPVVVRTPRSFHISITTAIDQPWMTPNIRTGGSIDTTGMFETANLPGSDAHPWQLPVVLHCRLVGTACMLPYCPTSDTVDSIARLAFCAVH